MLMRKCDRCGAFYENNSKSNRTVLFGTVNGLGHIDQAHILRHYDVCDDCVKSFLEWISNEENTDENTDEELKIL